MAGLVHEFMCDIMKLLSYDWVEPELINSRKLKFWFLDPSTAYRSWEQFSCVIILIVQLPLLATLRNSLGKVTHGNRRRTEPELRWMGREESSIIGI